MTILNSAQSQNHYPGGHEILKRALQSLNMHSVSIQCRKVKKNILNTMQITILATSCGIENLFEGLYSLSKYAVSLQTVSVKVKTIFKHYYTLYTVVTLYHHFDPTLDLEPLSLGTRGLQEDGRGLYIYFQICSQFLFSARKSKEDF